MTDDNEETNTGTDAPEEVSAEASTEASTEEKETDDQEVEITSDAENITKTVSSQNINIDTLLQVPVSLAIEVGRTRMALGDLLETQEGTVIELDRPLDDPLDILVNGALIAHGVVVLENDSFGIQITDIISMQERARSL